MHSDMLMKCSQSMSMLRHSFIDSHVAKLAIILNALEADAEKPKP